MIVVDASAPLEGLLRTPAAEALEAPLLTRDRRLAAAAGHRARIEVA